MIGKIPDKRRDGKSSFRDLISYCLAKDPSKVIHVGHQNILSTETAAVEMEALATDNKRCKDPVFHMILSWREMELPTNEQAGEAVEIALKELGLSDCQALWVLQNDTHNRHVHIVVNRIDPETCKAIIPANGWTKKALERAARKIELAQGWEIERSGFYQVTDDGKIIEKARGGEPSISSSAKDSEAHTAAKSAERIAQETAAPVIREAKTWEELHRKLAEQGIAFERKGSGAVLSVNGVIVKASKAGRDISLSKLEARFGEYRPRGSGVIVEIRAKEPVERVGERGVKSNWERYTAEREKYFLEKKETAATLAARQKEERAKLSSKQKSERDQLFSRSWKGMGSSLNRQRSVMAAKQQSEKLNLKDRQKRERDEMKQYFPSRFPNFKTWLETAEESPEAFLSFRYPDAGTIRGTGEAHDANAIPTPDIRAFAPSVWNKGGVAYRTHGESEAQFIDYGKKIVMADKCGEEAILAALQLANQKWGGAVVNGSDEYKKKCVELAIRHNLKLSNPELAAQVEEDRKGMTQQRQEVKAMQTTDKKAAFTRYADAVGAERYRITVTEFTEGGVKAFIHDRQNGGYEGKTRDEILGDIQKFSAYSRYNKNIIVTPISGDKHHILVDDLTQEKLKQFKEDGYSPSCVIESSPENYQAVITIPSVEGDSSKDREAANKLTKELNIKYGDPKLSGSVHGHRLPPFPNQKPKHKRPDGTFPDTSLIETNEGICGKALQELESINSALKEAEEKTRRTAETKNRASGDRFTGANAPNDAYWIHYRDIAAKFTGALDYSRMDALIGIRMRATDYSPGEVESAIENNAPAMRRETMSVEAFEAKYRNRDWKRYAAETTEKYVFGPRGAIQFERALDYRPLYMRLEGRDAIAERRAERERLEQARAESKKGMGR
jgi:hypothetical protein